MAFSFHAGGTCCCDTDRVSSPSGERQSRFTADENPDQAVVDRGRHAPYDAYPGVPSRGEPRYPRGHSANHLPGTWPERAQSTGPDLQNQSLDKPGEGSDRLSAHLAGQIAQDGLKLVHRALHPRLEEPECKTHVVDGNSDRARWHYTRYCFIPSLPSTVFSASPYILTTITPRP